MDGWEIESSFTKSQLLLTTDNKPPLSNRVVPLIYTNTQIEYAHKVYYIINPRRTCAERVTIVVLYVCEPRFVH